MPRLGLEIEVNWSSYFPQEYATWFRNGSRKYSDFSELERKEFDSVCDRLDFRLLPLLESTAELGIERGRDAYWEFVFPPLAEVSDIMNLVSELTRRQALPIGKHSLHITIDDILPDADARMLLFALEILSWINATRIRQGFHPESSRYVNGWARKGTAGMRLRPQSELRYWTVATEFRTLLLPENLQETEGLLQFSQKFAEVVGKRQRWEKTENLQTWLEIKCALLAELASFGLDGTILWENPNTQPELWEKYALFLELYTAVPDSFALSSVNIQWRHDQKILQLPLSFCRKQGIVV